MAILRTLLVIISTIAILISTIVFNHARLSCHWKSYDQNDPQTILRMVVIADPQMEGDAKLDRLGEMHGRIDLGFNDAYMRFIYQSMMAPSWKPFESFLSVFGGNENKEENRRLQPTHVAILGDLFSSQWIDNQEFDIRVSRFKSIFLEPKDLSAYQQQQQSAKFEKQAQQQQQQQQSPPLLINITGNHDIGYGYDITQDRVDRWEAIFGASNFVSTIDISSATGIKDSKLHLVVLNTMLLDGPSRDENLRGQTWDFLQQTALIKEDFPDDKILLLTHIPLYKEAGLCVDPPDTRVDWDQTIIEQTMLSQNTSAWILNELRPDLILNGHDHFGCDTIHIRRQGLPKNYLLADPTEAVNAGTSRFEIQDNDVLVREITQRSMMAEYGGFTGLLEIKVGPRSVSSESAYDDSLMVDTDGEQEADDDNDDEFVPTLIPPPTLSRIEMEAHYSACGFYDNIQVWTVLITDAIVGLIWMLVAVAWVVRKMYRIALMNHLKNRTLQKSAEKSKAE